MYILLVALFLLPVGTSVTQSYGTYETKADCEAARTAYNPVPKKFVAVTACVKLGE